MKRKLLLVFTIFSVAAFCATRLAARRQQPPHTERLLQDLQSEGCCPPEFTPSPELAQRYRLHRLGRDSAYCVNGFLSVEKKAQPSDFSEFGIIVGTQIDSLWTVHVPVQHLPALLNAKGVKVFEVGKKAKAKGGIRN
ncbi:MAG: hypothetical protein LBB79_02820 [Prevotellaceae bacterium]|jgi:hypothetical protein|nr:hypothetical protein [Prevotellaceae bacterium]